MAIKNYNKQKKSRKIFKKDLNEITSGNPKHKSDSQLYMIKNVKNLYNSKQKNIDLLNDNAKIRSEPFTNQKKTKQQEQDLKYQHQNKCFKYYQQLLHKCKSRQ